MEAQAPYLSNLSPRLADWLALEGFTVRRDDYPGLTLLTAEWTSPKSERFELVYTWQCGPSADAFCQLRAWTAACWLTSWPACSSGSAS